MRNESSKKVNEAAPDARCPPLAEYRDMRYLMLISIFIQETEKNAYV
jgi:hypothetical protein